MPSQQDEKITRWNMLVYHSQAMIEAKAEIADAMDELNHGEGWGTMPLDAAIVKLKFAIDILELLKATPRI